jgi:hypothetical protein
MIRKSVVLFLIIALATPAFAASPVADQEYVSKLDYQRNKLEVLTKKRVVHETRQYSRTDIDTTVYTEEAYSRTYGDITTSSLSQAEDKETTDWYIYKGGIRELSDLEFLGLVGDQAELERVQNLEEQRHGKRLLGAAVLGLGIAAMIGGAALGAGQSVINGGALATVAGFFITAFNISPRHYILPDYAQEKTDEYNIALKKKLNLPLDYN